jgi:hypothetical protein
LVGCDGLGVEFTVFDASGVLGFEFGELNVPDGLGTAFPLFDDGRATVFESFPVAVGRGVELIVFAGSDGLGAEFPAFDGEAGRDIESLLSDALDGLEGDEKFGRPFSPFVIADGGRGTGRFAGPGFAGPAFEGAAAVPGVAGDAGVVEPAGFVATGRIPGCGGRGTLRPGIGCDAFIPGRESEAGFSVAVAAGEPGLPGCDCSAFTGGFGAFDGFGVEAGFAAPDSAGVVGDPGLAGCAAFGIPPRTGCIPGPG